MYHWNHWGPDGASGHFRRLPRLPLVFSPSLFSSILGPQADSDLLSVITGYLLFLECVTDVLTQCVLSCVLFFSLNAVILRLVHIAVLPYCCALSHCWVASCCRHLLADIFPVLSSDECSCYDCSCMNLGVDVCFYFSSVPRWLLLLKNFYFVFSQILPT